MIKQIANFNRQASVFEEYSDMELQVIRTKAKSSRFDDWLSDHPKLLKVLIAILEVAMYFAWIKKGGRIAVMLLLAAAKALQDRTIKPIIN